MTTRRPGRRDPLEAAIEGALQPGRFIASRGSWDFVSSLEEIAAQLDALVRTDARRALGLYETFLAGCYEKAEELDDSGGNFATFVVSLSCGWIRARQAASADADETARRLAKSHPDVAAKVYRALGMRILTAKKSKYYEAALSHFENGKRCYERSDLHREWAALVAEVRQAHHRKAGFMAGFERLAAGHGPSDAPSFLDRARHRWSARAEP